MDIRELRCVQTIASERTLARAAEALHVSRQAVAKTLRQVERQTATRVFERLRGALVPTEAGAELLRDAETVLAAFDEFCGRHLAVPTNENAAAPWTAPQREPLSIALVTGGSVGLPPKLLEDFLTAHPRVSLSVEEMNSDAVLGAVADGNVDLGILGTHPRLIAAFDSLPLLHVGVWVRVPAGHPLADRTAIALADLHGQTMVTAGPHNHLHRFVMDRCAEAGVQPNVGARTTEAAMIRQLAHELGALYFAFPPALSPQPPHTVTVKLAIDEGELFGTYAVRRRGGRANHAARLFWDYARARTAAEGAGAAATRP